jgi:hypothetical protein
MAINTINIKNILWFFIVCFFVFAFPLQVYFNSTFPILLPHFFLLIFIFLFFKLKINNYANILEVRISLMTILILLFVICLIVNPICQFLFFLIPTSELLTIELNFLLPFFCFVYFSNYCSITEKKIFILAIFLSGLLIGIDFAFDSYVKLATGHIREYSYKAYEYSQMRAGMNEITDSRINPFFRSMGLLESHSISASWIAFSAFSAFYVINKEKKFIRNFITILSFLLLFISLNFTAILCFSLVYLIYYTNFFRSTVNIFKTLVFITILTTVIFLLIYFILGPAFYEIFSDNIFNQVSFLFNNSERVSHSDILSRYPLKEYIIAHPFSLIFGNGYCSTGLSQGGDLGFLESIFILGIPLYLLLFIGSIIIMRYSYLQIFGKISFNNSKTVIQNNKELLFAISIFSFIFFSEIHYSIWVAKSIIPILYFSLALILKNLKFHFNLNILNS